jgi:hypothetical protein
MGSNNSSSGNGGGDKTRFGYTKPKPKFVLPSVAILKGLTEGVTKMAKESNLKRRKKFISKSGLTSDDINMSDEYLSSKEGLAELKKQGYTTISDVTSNNGNDNGGAKDTGGQVVQAPEVTAPTTAEVSQATTTKAEDPIELRKRRAKARGRTPTIMTGVTGATGSLTLGKPSLLGS